MAHIFLKGANNGPMQIGRITKIVKKWKIVGGNAVML
jgi:hypothetical protein